MVWIRFANIFLCILTLSCKSSWATRIEFYGGEYSNILVALSPKLNVTTCQSLITEIQTTLSGVSSKLYTASDGRAHLGKIRILVPREWTPTACNLNLSVATAADSYNSADIKITEGHPLGKSLPWTSQFKGCGESGEDIFIPPGFLVSSLFSSEQKSQLLLHEWAKFRYGVFEEHGYFGDEAYPACSVRQGSLHFTACSTNTLEPLTNITSADCRSEVDAKTTQLRNQLGSATSSLMSMPQLERISRFCVNASHNKLAKTKHNAMCGRRSVGEVIDSHQDFRSSYISTDSKQAPPQFEIIRHSFSEYTPGYAFIIEDTAYIREESRLRHIKQAITQMVDIMEPNTMAAVSTFSGGVAKKAYFVPMNTDANKKIFIDSLPDINSLPFTSRISPFAAKQSTGSNNLYFIFRDILAELETKSHKWNMFLITSSPSTSIKEARDLVHNTAHSLSLLTFDDSNGWLEMYTTPNAHNIIVMPHCILNGNACSSKTSALAVDEFVTLMRDQDSPRFLEKVAETEVQSGRESSFIVESTASRVSKFFIYFPTFTNSVNEIRFTSPSGAFCAATRVFAYEYVLKMNSANSGNLNCQYQSGTWLVDLSSLPLNVNYTIQAFAESDDEPNRLLVRTSIGAPSNVELMPNSQLTPIYARVMDLDHRPVIDAEVGVNFHTSLSTSESFLGSLKDDGKDPDIIKNDGVYSAYLQGYSVTPAYHTGQVTVTAVTSKTRSIVSLSNSGGYSAALLDPNLSTKCCGSSVPVADTLPVPRARLSTLLPGFKTGESFDSTTLPPSKIGSIQVTSDDGIILITEFIAPGAVINSGRVDHYDTCCALNDSTSDLQEPSCHPIYPSECSPVDAGQIQICSLNRETLELHYLNNTAVPPNQNLTMYLFCGIRGVNALMVPGGISNALIEIDINIESEAAIPEPGGSKSLTCDSISDDCLPIVVFWALIGCIIGLLLVILALIICWCCTSKTSNNKRNSSQEVLMKRNRESNTPDKDPPPYNVFVNKAYIQETDGQIKLVAAEGELLPFESNESSGGLSRSQRVGAPAPSLRRRSVSTEGADRENNQLGNPVMNEARLYKAYLGSKPEPPPKPKTNIFQSSKSEEYLAPVPRNRYPKFESGYANSNTTNNNVAHQPSRAPISTIFNPNMDDEILPIYASVNRNGRRVYPDANSTMPLPMMTNNSTFQRPRKEDPSLMNSTLPIQNRFSRPPSSQKQAQSLPPTRPSSARLDAFPSSDSETYSDMSRGVPIIPVPPPVPPPFPKTSSSIPTFARNSPDRHNLQPSGNQMPTRSSLSPPSRPPPAPPRQSAPIPSTNKNQNSDSEYDDDSEHWDDEDFEFAPVNAGDSYA